MFFIWAGTFLAWAMVILGAFRVSLGLFVAIGFDGEQMLAASRRYLGAANSGEVIDQGIITLAAGIVVGLLVEIAKKRSR